MENIQRQRIWHFQRLLTLSWGGFLSYRNHPIDLIYQSMDWFLFDRDFRHDGVEKELSYLIKRKFKTCKGNITYTEVALQKVFWIYAANLQDDNHTEEWFK